MNIVSVAAHEKEDRENKYTRGDQIGLPEGREFDASTDDTAKDRSEINSPIKPLKDVKSVRRWRVRYRLIE